MLPQTLRIYVCQNVVDMRKSFDGLAALVEQTLFDNPRSGALYCFINKRKNRLKILWWDKSGYCILYKRLHGHRFLLPKGDAEKRGAAQRIDGKALSELIAGVAYQSKHRR